MINVVVIGTHHLQAESIAMLIESNDDFKVLGIYSRTNDFLHQSYSEPVHIVIKNIHKITNDDISDVEAIQQVHLKAKILIISYAENEETIFNIIKVGAKGFLSHDATSQDLFEAIYSLRNGYDYFSKCITNILLNRYVSSIQKNEKPENEEVEKLSSREIEILSLWGSSYTNPEIADTLHISIRTVETHKTHIMQKLNLKTQVDLIKYAIKNNIIDL
ncbi:MAG: response regulator transcription factor [Bacteroidales bacterium]|nr:response regulator transcription factor [Bacteroidales bacterium]MBQ3677322.1 response regulator transcription factor [Bacteroidales bacterium]MBR4497994.1 response regulator transcription factor [Bacteroidales bacterium]MBR4691107.1 response regulator transcription factor [Bacteroidales bacterium]MBR7034431.1 response regulator transcription factor [Bacteroidales bacterium]